MNEDTLVVTLDLPFGQSWAWYPDANMVALKPGMCPEQQEQALSEVQAHWRRSIIRVVHEPSMVATQPLTTLSHVHG